MSLKRFPLYKNAVDSLDIVQLKNFSYEDLKKQFDLFLEKLIEVISKYSVEELRSPTFDNKILLKKLFSPTEKHFEGIELIMHSLAVSCVKVSCESVLESFVSQYEHHFGIRRTMDEESANEEFNICSNGPELANSDSVIKDALDSYWAGKSWHFYRSYVDKSKLNTYVEGSKVLDKLSGRKSGLSVMNK